MTCERGNVKGRDHAGANGAADGAVFGGRPAEYFGSRVETCAQRKR
jgi:hypothetical protein